MTEPPLARVLFVDDEPRVLDGLRRSLHAKRRVWQMSFACGAEQALELIAAEPCDVIISDMRMPGIDGAELLTRVREQHPGIARVVLSGHTEADAALRAALVAHRFLHKPCDPSVLIQVITQLTSGLARAGSAERREIAGAVCTLPSAQHQLDQLSAVVQDPHLTLDALLDVAQADVALTAKVLQLANSAFFGARPRLVSMSYSLSALGLPMLRALLTSDARTGTWRAADDEVQDAVLTSWEHSLATALIARQLATPALAPFAEVGGLLRDVGLLAGLASRQAAVRDDLRVAADSGQPLRDVTTARCGYDWAEVGADLLDLWGLPQPIVTAVAGQHDRHRDHGTGLGIGGALRAAHLLVQRTRSTDPTDTRADDELAHLLRHPQLRHRGLDWSRLAEDASASAQRVCRPSATDPSPRRVGVAHDRAREPVGMQRRTPEVLVVDDDDVLRGVVQELLQAHGFSTRSAPDGARALREIETVRPDAVVLDLRMPGVSGFEVLARIRGLGGQAVPVLLLTATDDDATVGQAWAAGTDFCLPKPLVPDDLLALLRALFPQDAAPARP